MALNSLEPTSAHAGQNNDCWRERKRQRLGVLVLVVLRRSQDIWWFWCVHFALDMMQFDALPAAGALGS